VHKGYNVYRHGGKGAVKIEKGQECAGKDYKYQGVAHSLADCEKRCKSTDIFIYGTNEFGTERCYGNKGCRCYCYFNQVSQCRKNEVHKGYNVYRHGGKGAVKIEKGQECAGKDYKYQGVAHSLADCEKRCKSTDIFIYGTNEFGTVRCYGNRGCRCYCYYRDTTISACRKTEVHKGYNLYGFYQNRKAAIVG
jgi:hypothetical protein